MSAFELHPLDFPELAAIIGRYLSRKDLTTCLRACKRWHAAFLPMVWHTVDKKTTRRALQRHGHLVKIIKCENKNCPPLSKLVLPNLTTLEIKRSQLPSLPVPSFTLCLQNNPTVTNVNFTDEVFNLNTPEFWKAVADLPRPLRQLKVSCAFFYVESSADFLMACSHAEMLDLKYYRSSSSALSNEDIARIESLRFHRLKTLNLRGSIVDEMGFFYAVLSHCPALERLTLDYQSYCQFKQQADCLISLARTRPWPHLKHLYVSIQFLGEEQYHDLLEALSFQPLESLEIHDRIPPQTFTSLMHTQFPTITHLSVMGTREPATTSEMNQRILKSCPLLISFKGNRMSSADIIDGPFAGPWVCLRLEELYLGFDIAVRKRTVIAPQVPPELREWFPAAYLDGHQGRELRQLKQREDFRQQRGVFEQLARLTDLRVLDVISRDVIDDGFEGLSFHLEDGLAMLEPLRQLHVLSVHPQSPHLNKHDVEWMAHHWKGLQRLKGSGIEQAGSHAIDCWSILQKHGIFL